MRSRNARERALLSLCVAVLCLLAFGTTASADESAPRAAPAARAYPREFASYEALIEYGSAVAAQQGALDARLADARAGYAARASEAVAGAARQRGGTFDRDDERDARVVEARLRAYAASLARSEHELVAAGALTADALAWRMPTEGEITQPFGETDLWVEPARDYQGVAYPHFHEGVDIAGAWAAPVVAPARGRVVFAGLMGDGAEVVVLAHDQGIVTMYAHLDAWSSAPPVSAGDEVAAGQRIGTVGLSGITTGLHLHWAAWRNGELIDPLSLIDPD